MRTKPPVSVAARMVVTLVLALGVGCGGNDDSDAAAPEPTCGSSTETYTNFGAAFLGKYCDSCHGFTQADVQLDPATLIDFAVTSTYMPPGSPAPTTAERMDFGTWLACGAP
jgi:hypothetical protein